jgi:hypothetical protein
MLRFALRTFAFYLRATLAPYGQYSIIKDSLTTVLVDLAFVFGWSRLEQVGMVLRRGLVAKSWLTEIQEVYDCGKIVGPTQPGPKQWGHSIE